MTRETVTALIKDNPKSLAGAELVETHISWVILGENTVLKIKRPVQFSFLDFSTLEKRRYYCQRELELNQRLTERIYLDVVPIGQDADGRLSCETGHGTVIDYAVKMKRLDNKRQMDLLLEKDLVNRQHMEQLAQQLTNFHMSTEVITMHPNLKAMQDDFADLLKVESFVAQQWGTDAANLLNRAVVRSGTLLDTLQDRIYERHLEGFTVDGHGDLHAKNIFLLDEPVIFDCIEFNDHLRHLDVLNELAFLCMDLDFHQQASLGDYLIEQYNQRNTCLYNGADEQIFLYYKFYRANVRLKVSALTAMRTEDPAELKRELTQVAGYLDLFKEYLTDL